ncbi:MAG: hemolysin family protein [Elusimicrobiota bacterium]
MIIFIKFVLFIISIKIGAFFTGTEMSLYSLSLTNITKFKEKYPSKSKCLMFWEEKPDHIISAILIGTNLAWIGAGVISTSIAIDISRLNTGLDKNILIVLFLVLTAVIIFIFGEILPKVYSRHNPEAVCVAGVEPLFLFSRAVAPAAHFLVRVSEFLLGLSGLKAIKESPFLTRDELKQILNFDDTFVSDISKKDYRMLTNILRFTETKIKDVMVPRSDVFAIDYGAGFDNAVEHVLASRYSRVPVYKGTVDNVTGIIYAKDLIISRRTSSLFVLDDLIRPAYFVPETAPIGSLLHEFRQGRHHLAIVVDEYGLMTGLITIEDIVEEIVGEVYDEYDIHEQRIIESPSGGWIVGAREPISYINSELKINLPQSESFSTIAGWIISVSGRIPSVGEKLNWKNTTIEIIEADRKKVSRVKITKNE